MTNSPASGRRVCSMALCRRAAGGRGRAAGRCGRLDAIVGRCGRLDAVVGFVVVVNLRVALADARGLLDVLGSVPRLLDFCAAVGVIGDRWGNMVVHWRASPLRSAVPVGQLAELDDIKIGRRACAETRAACEARQLRVAEGAQRIALVGLVDELGVGRASAQLANTLDDITKDCASMPDILRDIG